MERNLFKEYCQNNEKAINFQNRSNNSFALQNPFENFNFTVIPSKVKKAKPPKHGKQEKKLKTIKIVPRYI